LERHLNIEHRGYRFAHICPFRETCPQKSFVTPSALLSHLIALHPDYGPIVSVVSSKSTGSDSDDLQNAFNASDSAAQQQVQQQPEPKLTLQNADNIIRCNRPPSEEAATSSSDSPAAPPSPQHKRTKPRNRHQCPHCVKSFPRVSIRNAFDVYIKNTL
jgi:hypothetical protein